MLQVDSLQSLRESSWNQYESVLPEENWKDLEGEHSFMPSRCDILVSPKDEPRNKHMEWFARSGSHKRSYQWLYSQMEAIIAMNTGHVERALQTTGGKATKARSKG